MSDILPQRESWEITNLSTVTIDLFMPPTPSVSPGQTIDLMDYVSPGIVMNSDVYRNFLNSGTISTTGYLHTHDDKSNIDHSHYGLQILTAGFFEADFLHTHKGLDVLTGGTESIADEFHTHDFPEVDIDLTEYVRKDGSITQLSDVFDTGAEIHEAVLNAHTKDHSLLSHVDNSGDDPVTVENLKRLMDGRNADSLHTHDFSDGGGVIITDTAHNELSGLNTGDYYHLTSGEKVDFNTLVGGGNADPLHTHSAFGGVSAHNSLIGIDGEGTYHLTQSHYDTLTNGSNADLLHTHDISGSGVLIAQVAQASPHLDYIRGFLLTDPSVEITIYCQIADGGMWLDEALPYLEIGDSISVYLADDGEYYCSTVFQNMTEISNLTIFHNELEGLQGGSSVLDEFYHLSLEEHDLLIRFGEDSSGLTFDDKPIVGGGGVETAYELPLGQTCDEGWEGGLFPFDEDTRTSCAIDDLNEVLGALAPAPAPSLNNITANSSSGVTGKLSFGVSHAI